MTTRVINNFKTYFFHNFGGKVVGNASEASESFVIENEELIKDIKRGLILDISDVDYVLQNCFEAQETVYKRGYRAFRAAFYRELEAYGLKRTAHGLASC